MGRILLANPVELKRLGSGRHTDQVRAERLAKKLALGTLPTAWVPPQAIRGFRRLVQYRDRLVRDRRRCLTQAKGVLRRHGLDGPRRADPLRHVRAEEVGQLPEVDRIFLLSALRQRRSVEAELRAVEAELARRVAKEPGIQLLRRSPLWGPWRPPCGPTWATPPGSAPPSQVTRNAGLDASGHQSEGGPAPAASAGTVAGSYAPSWWRRPTASRGRCRPAGCLLPAQAVADWAPQGRGGPGPQGSRGRRSWSGAQRAVEAAGAVLRLGEEVMDAGRTEENWEASIEAHLRPMRSGTVREPGLL